MKSIHGKLRNGLLIGQGVLWALAAIGVWMSVRARLYSEFDNELRFTSAALRFHVFGRSFDEQIGKRWPEFSEANSGWYYQVWQENGTILTRSKNLGDKDLPLMKGNPEDSAANRGYTIKNLTGLDGQRLRGASVAGPRPDFRFRRDDSNRSPTTLLFARSLKELERSLGLLTIAVAVAGLMAAAATVWLVRFWVTRGLQPIREMGDKASTITVSNLGIRFEPDEFPKELQPFSTQLNHLLDRIEAGFSRERRFSADLAHEMRTPVAELKSIAELLVRWPEESNGAHHGEILEVANQMQGMIESLLALSRFDADLVSPEIQSCALAPLIDDCWKPHAAHAADKQLELDENLADSTTIETDPDLFRLIVSNLISNAVSYTPNGGRILIESGNGSDSLFTISNDVSGLKQDDISHLMERFWRHDSSRTGDDHFGLGLSVAAACAERLNLSLCADLDEEDRFLSFRLRPLRG